MAGCRRSHAAAPLRSRSEPLVLSFVRTRLIPPIHKLSSGATCQRQTASNLIKPGFLLAPLLVAHLSTGAGLREYNAKEVKKRNGENATVVRKVASIEHGRRH